MRNKKHSPGIMAVVTILFLMLATSTLARAQQERVLHSFNQYSRDGNEVNASVILDTSGNLYGTTTGGGMYNSGTVYKLTAHAGSGWVETRLHDFGHGNDGALLWSRVVLDTAGNLYGTTSGGGTYGNGTVFELTRDKGGSWTEKILYNFNISGYFYPNGLIVDGAGNLYGTTNVGGAYGWGMAYELTPTLVGDWTLTALHDFNSSVGDGLYPVASLVSDTAGNLYGTTWFGGAYGAGTAFELMPTTGGWTETILHSFSLDGKDGSTPSDNLILDAHGNLYGTTVLGGAYHKGVVFELTPSPGGDWTEKVLHSFDPNGKDGYSPFGGLVSDAAGSLYGTTSLGGAQWQGAVYKLAPNAGGGWTESIVYSFRPSGTDADRPLVGLAIDAAGNLYGTSTNGGVYGGGALYGITP